MELAEAVWAFMKHFTTGLCFLTIFVFLYVKITPHQEVALIRAGNGAAALGLLGAVVGFSIALARAIEVSSVLYEAAIWAGIALVAQIGAQFIAQWMFPKLYRAIEENNWAAASVKAGAALAIGMVNAACMTP